jgi:hypothetical protein
MTRDTVPDMLSKKSTVLAAALSATTAIASSGAAIAEEGIIKDASVHETRPTKLDLTGSLGFLGETSIGLAGWYSFPIVKDGFIAPINDSFNLEFGAALDYTWWNYGYGVAGLDDCGYHTTGITPMGGVRWDFYLTPSWTVFGKAKAGIGYRTVSGSCNGVDLSDARGGTVFVPDGGAGAYWNFAPDMGMRFEVGYRGASVGLSINL